MSPKEKAERLSYFYWNLLKPYIKDEQERGRLSVKSAIIAVEEIIENKANNHSCLDATYDYWDAVLTELKAMQ